MIENKHKRKVIGFDAFGKFPHPKKDYKNNKADKVFAKRHDNNIGLGINIKLLKKYLKKRYNKLWPCKRRCFKNLTKLFK